MKAATTAFNQEKALVGAFSVITNLRMELFQALEWTNSSDISSLLPRNKKDDEGDDPSSPYSVNYGGELHTHSQGYSYAIKDENGDKTGYLTFSSPPQSKYNFSVPKGDRRLELETKVCNVLTIMVLLKTLS